MLFKTEQEEFWRGEFGDKYVDRNNAKELLAADTYLFSKILERTKGVDSVIEFGSNIGLNLEAIKRLKPNVECAAVEINHKAATILRNNPVFDDNKLTVYEESILDFKPSRQWDFALIKGVLIHINPEELSLVYKKLYETSRKYICIAEYYNPFPIPVSYGGREDMLFKRDFAGEFIKMYPDVEVCDYGFVWHEDNNFKLDDITWFLLEKR